jgi:excisionase family DNA binding protein
MTRAIPPGWADDTTEIADLLARLAVLITPAPTPATVEPHPLPQRILLTVEEAATQLGLGRTRMFALIKSGAIESVRIGRLRRVPRDSITAYAGRLLAEQSFSPTTESETSDAA